MDLHINFKELVHSLGDGMVISDAQGTIVYWNPAAERIFGFTQSEALGQSLDLIIPERLRKRELPAMEINCLLCQLHINLDALYRLHLRYQ